MGSTYKPGWQSKAYHNRSGSERAEIADKVDKLFREKTGVTRKLHRTSAADRELRHIWLRIRDEVMEEIIAEEDLEFRRELFIADLPAIVIEDMNALGWTEAAELLETWSERPSSTAPLYSAAVTNVVKMDWILTFTRAKSLYDQMITDKVWTNDASRKRIAEHLKKTPRGVGATFGDLSKSVTVIDDEWINSRSISNGLNFDGLAGALGSFHLQVAIVGTVLSTGGGAFELSVYEVGIYAKDSFDFNGSQFLGFWGYRDDPVYNEDFRQWRSDTNAGGDFRVFSDVKRTKLSVPARISGTL